MSMVLFKSGNALFDVVEKEAGIGGTSYGSYFSKVRWNSNEVLQGQYKKILSCLEVSLMHSSVFSCYIVCLFACLFCLFD